VYRIFGLKPQEFGATYEAFLENVHPDDRKKVDDAYSGSLREGKNSYEVEHRVVRKDNGEIRIVHEKGQHFRNVSGKIIRSVGMVQDITEQRKTEEALIESERLYHTVFDNSQDGFQLIELVYDEHGKPIDHKFLRVNSAYEKIIGVKASDILDKTAKYISPNQELHWLEVPDRVAKTGISEHVELYNKDINKTLDCYYFLYSENVVGTLFRDVTERKNMEKQLQDKERLAAIGATAGMVGHDIRNPLQAITGDLFLAKSELSELPENENKNSALESLDEIQNNIDYINKIVADLQDYARPLNPRAQETNIKSLFNEILAKNGYPRNIKVEVKVEDKAETIMADPDYLKRIAANLTLNAVQAMPDGGKLTIHAYVDKVTNDVLITVKDTGVGIPEDVKPKLFTPMITTKSKGQGFGLAVVKRMIEGLGGTVTFESTEGKGTTFIVRLPPPQRAER
jgi:PAS domain S-box-containing protein